MYFSLRNFKNALQFYRTSPLVWWSKLEEWYCNIHMLSGMVVIGWESTTYTTTETMGSVELSAIIMNPPLEREVVVTATTSDGTASKFNRSLIIGPLHGVCNIFLQLFHLITMPCLLNLRFCRETLARMSLLVSIKMGYVNKIMRYSLVSWSTLWVILFWWLLQMLLQSPLMI